MQSESTLCSIANFYFGRIVVICWRIAMAFDGQPEHICKPTTIFLDLDRIGIGSPNDPSEER